MVAGELTTNPIGVIPGIATLNGLATATTFLVVSSRTRVGTFLPSWFSADAGTLSGTTSAKRNAVAKLF